MGRHRKPTRLVVHAARIAVGGLALAEITGGMPAIPAHAETPIVVPAAYSTVQPVMTRHHHHSHHAHKAPPHLAQPVRVVMQPAPAVTAVDATALDPTAQDASYDTGQYQQLYDHYTVQAGDTLTHIAAAYGVDWASLWSINSDTVAHPDAIYPGQILRLPA